MKYYKILHDGRSCHGGELKWSLPHDGKPGKWMPKIEGELIPCENGYHLCRKSDVLEWLDAEIYEAEHRGEVVESDSKVVVRQVRLLRKIETWNDKTARLFAVWCAREALKLVDNPDPRSVEAVDVAERYANGQADDEDLNAAWAVARDAAWAVARAAAWAAAWAAAEDAAWAAARAAAEDAARDAARAAAEDAAWAVARAAAWAVARAAAWAAAWAAAEDAAWDAARAAAEDAARDAAEDAARDAARDAAWAAARAAQTEKLFEILGEED